MDILTSLTTIKCKLEWVLTLPAHCTAPEWSGSSISSEVRLRGKLWRILLGWTERGFASAQEDLFVRSQWCGTQAAGWVYCCYHCPGGGFAPGRGSTWRSLCCRRYQRTAAAKLDRWCLPATKMTTWTDLLPQSAIVDLEDHKCDVYVHPT